MTDTLSPEQQKAKMMIELHGKKRAIIVIDEMIKSYINMFSTPYNLSRKTFWQSVRIEIEKM